MRNERMVWLERTICRGRSLAVFVLLGAAVGCAGVPSGEPSGRGAADADSLRAIHLRVIDAHLTDDVEGWAAVESDAFVVASRGEIFRPTRAERDAQRTQYLGATEFDVYRDLVDPVIQVSDDGTLGWVVVQVEASGTYRHDDGRTEPLSFVSAWIEMYRKVDGRWLMVGNVSNFRPPPEPASP